MAAGWDADRYQRQFGSSPAEVIARVRAALRPGGRFIADYWRLRFVAVAGGGAARPAKLHRQMTGDRNR